MKIYAVRHGLTECNKRDILNGRIDEPLAAEGIEQAKMLALAIPNSVRHLYSSPMLRARQTAEIITSECSLPIYFHDGLQEVDLGRFTGKSWTEIEFGEEFKEKHRSVQYDYRPEGESVADVKRRVLSFLRRIQEIHGDGETLLVTHGGIIRILQLLESSLPKLPSTHVKNAFLYVFDIKKHCLDKSP